MATNRAIATALSALVALVGASGAAAEDRPTGSPWAVIKPVATRAGAARFLADVTRQIAANRYAAAWRSLYPPHQLVAPLDEYVRCELKSPIAGTLDRITVVRSRWSSVHVAGQTQRLRGVKVTFFLRLVDDRLDTAVGLRPTFAAVWIGWRWAWMLPAARYRMYLTSSC